MSYVELQPFSVNLQIGQQAYSAGYKQYQTIGAIVDLAGSPVDFSTWSSTTFQLFWPLGSGFGGIMGAESAINTSDPGYLTTSTDDIQNQLASSILGVANVPCLL